MEGGSEQIKGIQHALHQKYEHKVVYCFGYLFSSGLAPIYSFNRNAVVPTLSVAALVYRIEHSKMEKRSTPPNRTTKQLAADRR